MISRILAILLATSLSFAGEVASSLKASTSSTKNLSANTNLGDCKPSKSEPEATARKLVETADLGKEEILARLIYSESLSTGYWNNGCNAKSDIDIMTSIGWGIMNRVKTKAKSSLDAYSDVIFGRLQFSTSFSGKKTNPFAEAFLCPQKSESYLSSTKKKASATELYSKAQKLATQIIKEYEAHGIPETYKGITNFFYPESEYFGELRPTWARNKDATQNKGYLNILGVDSKPCVEFYKLK